MREVNSITDASNCISLLLIVDDSDRLRDKLDGLAGVTM